MTAGYCQPGSCRSRPVAWPPKSVAVPGAGAGRPRRRQAALTAAGAWTFVWIVTMWDMRERLLSGGWMVAGSARAGGVHAQADHEERRRYFAILAFGGRLASAVCPLGRLADQLGEQVQHTAGSQ